MVVDVQSSVRVALDNITLPAEKTIADVGEKSLLYAIDDEFDFKGGIWQLRNLSAEQEIPAWYMSKQFILDIPDSIATNDANVYCKDSQKYKDIQKDSNTVSNSIKTSIDRYTDGLKCFISYQIKPELPAVNKDIIDFNGVDLNGYRDEYFFVLNDDKDKWVKVDSDDATYGFLYTGTGEWISVQDTKEILFSGSVTGTREGVENFDLLIQISNIAMRGDHNHQNGYNHENLNYVPVIKVEISDDLYAFDHYC